MSIILSTAQTLVDQAPLLQQTVVDHGNLLQDVQAPSGIESAQKFLGTGAGKILVGFAAIIGVVIGIGGVIKAAPMFMNQKIGKGCLVVLGALVAFGLLINLNLTMSGAKTVSKVIGSIFESGDEFTDEYTSMGPNGFTITLPSADSNGTTSA